MLVAVGFSSKQGALRRGVLGKELDILVNYGLCPGTLKHCGIFQSTESGENTRDFGSAKQIDDDETSSSSLSLGSNAFVCSTWGSEAQ
ncbi:hypothetical protein KIW84_050552 [Lathyrus oleraceus]|uniref:Uncharacterized protein n=1 Tax=Pisum sativum TaxID=3888 RepID=A0A9D4WK07_PEA|nr:hypothetical protein KIW84_050552 [Pisum sativum]